MAEPQDVEEELPFISIIVPTYNRPEQLATCLKSLTGLDYPQDRFEIIIVDDGSGTPLDSLVSRFHGKINITLITQSNAGPASARNTGAKQASGKYIAFTDDDCAPYPNWLRALSSRFVNTPEHAVGGRTLNTLSNNIYSMASQVLIDYLYSYYNTDPLDARFFASNNLAIPAERFREMGGFNTTFPLAAGEDRDFCDLWRFHGYRMAYEPEALVNHAHKMSFFKFWRQHFNYGRGAFHFHKVRAQRKQEPLKVEPAAFYFNLVKYPFSWRKLFSSLGISCLIILSQLANVFGYYSERRSRKVGRMTN